MVIVVFSLCCLIWFAFYLRRRYILNSRLAYALQRPLLSRFLLSVLCAVSLLTCLNYLRCTLTQNSVVEYFLLTLICTAVLSSNLIAFFMTKGPLPNTYLNHTMKGWLRIDINKDFIPSPASKSELINYLEGFMHDVINQKGVRWEKIIIQSHLINPQFRRVMGNVLKTKEGIKYECEASVTPLSDVIKLNLFYGGNTRFKILTFKKHDNGFKVHKIGSIFCIYRTNRG